MALVFSNKGSIPLQAIRTFGVSVKDNDDAIGFFGTGLKYAIAVFLRNGCDISMWSDGTHYEFFAEPEEIRGKKFELVYMREHCEDGINDVPLGFTTELGKTWEPWMAFRELYCNAKDEHGDVQHMKKVPGCFTAHDDTTVFIVEGAAADQAWNERGHVFLEGDPKYTGSLANAHIGPGKHLYYRGIRVADLRSAARFDYNIHTHCDLTEDRTLKYQFQARHAITSLVLGSEDRDFIRDVLQTPRGFYEHDLDFVEVSMKPGDTFLDVAGELREQCAPLNGTAVLCHKQHAKRHILPYESIKLTSVQKIQLQRAKAVCTRLGCDMDEYPIVIMQTLGRGIWGRAENHTIYLSLEAFDMGTKILAGTLYEEFIHLAHSLRDETRDMQNFLIDKVMSLAEQLQGEPL